jgi:putative heme-binding domain-containing protein
MIDPRFFLRLAAVVAGITSGFAGKVALFDGTSFAGWEGDTTNTWRIQDGAFRAGSLEKKQERNDFLATVKEFGDFELTLKWKLEGTAGFVNGGVQFRSKRVPGHHEVSGYQADLGAGYDGALYDESRRNRVLAKPSDEVLAKASKPLGEWNDYRIRAEGPRIRIWLNGVLTADYTEADPAIPREGIIALQIHGDATSVVRYKELSIEELEAAKEEAKAEGPASRITGKLPLPRAIPPFEDGRFTLERGDVVVFAGSENMVLEQGTGALESRLAMKWKEVAPEFRHMGWEGDTVFRQNRMQEWGSWPSNLEAAGATVVVAWFGQVEVLDATKTAGDFSNSYGALLDEFAKRTPRIVVIGPPPFEKPADPRVPDNTGLNGRVGEFNEAVRQLAAKRGLVFVDLLPRLSEMTEGKLTRDGMHFTERGLGVVGKIIAESLGAEVEAPEALQRAIVEKNRLWFDTWRCMNWAFAFGDRTNQPFAGPAADRPPLVEELKQYQPLLAHADATVHALAAGKPAPEPLPPAPPRADPPALTAEEQMKGFTMREGFEVSLFADESLGVVRPIQIRWDERGRLWVACTPAYPQLQPGEHGNDYILILEDRDGDGRADVSSRFAEKLTMPMGFEFAAADAGGGLYVCESTQLVQLPDRDGDGKADGREVVLSGFGTGDTHQNANSLRWGPDGCLWFTQGYHIWSYVETPHGLAELNRSGIWRFNPRTRRLDSFLNESTAGLNCWGTAWDDRGQVFHGSGADFQIWHTTPAIIPTLHPLTLPTGMASSRGKSMEPEFLGSSHLPEDLRGVLLKSTYYTSQVQLYRLRDAGSGFASEELGDLMAGGNEFRPVETRVGPDGAIYVCDWLNPVIGHYQASYRDPRRDRSHGRIWRVTAKGRPLLEKPALGSMNAAERIERLASPERWERDAAKFALFRMAKDEVLAAAEAALKGARTTGFLYELSGVFAAHERSSPEIVARLMASADFRDRAWAARLVGIWGDKLEDPLGLLERAIADEHPRVRLEAVVACAWLPKRLAPAAVVLATRALDRPMDPPLNHALTLCIHALAPEWKPALAAGTLDFGGRIHALARVLTTVGDAGITAKVRELLDSGKLAEIARESLLAVLVQFGTPEDAEFAIARAPDSQAVMDALVAAAWRSPEAAYGGGLQSLLASPHRAAHVAACRIVAASGKDWGTAGRIAQLLADPAAPSPVRAAALGAVARLRGKEALADLLGFAASEDPLLRAAALAAAAPLDPAAVAVRGAELLAAVKSTAEVAPMMSPLLGQQGGPELLAKAVGEAKLPAESARLALQWMAEAGRDDAVLRDALNRAAGIVPALPDHSEALVKRLVAEAIARGDATRGKGVYAAAQSTCVACHKVEGQGGILGPDLSAIGRAMTPEVIVEAVLWPKRQVKEGFMLTQITTKDGRTLQGYVADESADSVTLKDVAGHPGAPIAKADIASRGDSGTLMPEGLTAWLSEQQRLDLLRYLFGLGK